jgi:hypothetical protein
VKKLETKGTLLDLHGGGKPEMSENTVHDVANRLLASPRKSLRVLSQEIGLQDYDTRLTYCRWFQTFTDENPGILDYTWFSDEAWFHLSGYGLATRRGFTYPVMV